MFQLKLYTLQLFICIHISLYYKLYNTLYFLENNLKKFKTLLNNKYGLPNLQYILHYIIYISSLGVYGSIETRFDWVRQGSKAPQCRKLVSSWMSSRQQISSCVDRDETQWTPPTPPWFKLNFNGATFTASQSSGDGIVVRNSVGRVYKRFC